MGTIFAKNFFVMDRPGGGRYDFDEYLHYTFEDHVKVSENLGEVFKIAGKIIATTRTSLSDVSKIISKDFKILDGFREDVEKNLTPNGSKGPYHESHFKVGDIWEETDSINLGTTDTTKENLVLITETLQTYKRDENGNIVYENEVPVFVKSEHLKFV